MKKELGYFLIGGKYGGDQNSIPDRMVQFAGCAAITACDSCIWFDLYRGTNLYPFDKNSLSERDYLRYSSKMMRQYFRPGLRGVDTLDMYIRDFKKYEGLRGGNPMLLTPFPGEKTLDEAEKAVRRQIDGGYPIPYLLLRHKAKDLDDFEWHWFLLTGYEQKEDSFQVKAVSFGKWYWMDFEHLWNTGFQEKGGMILFQEKEEAHEGQLKEGNTIAV
jgi:hypothetical protein